MRLVFAFPDIERSISGEDAEWLLSELLTANQNSVALAERLKVEQAADEPIKTSSIEKRTLLRIFERSTKPRSHDLRALEVAMYSAAFIEHHPPK
jgi:hypothetical protein